MLFHFNIELDKLSAIAVMTMIVTSSAIAQTPGSARIFGSAQLRAAIAQSQGQGLEESRRIDKIFGGTPANWDEHKWQVALVAADIKDNRFARFCGGSLIRQDWVLTAAHCVDEGTTINDIEILSGTGDLQAGGVRVKIASIFIHHQYLPEVSRPQFRPATNDIALLKLQSDAIGTPIELIPRENPDPYLEIGQDVVITGWGKMESGQLATSLMRVNVPLVSLDQCNSMASYDGAILETMLCAGRDQGGKDACAGDSGGPNTSKGKLIGIVSWGFGCGKPFKYGVYTNVWRFRDWIDDCLSPQEQCKILPFSANISSGIELRHSEPDRLINKAYDIFPRELADEVAGNIQSEAVADLRNNTRTVATLFLSDRFYNTLKQGSFSGLPVVRWNGFDYDSKRPRFIFDPSIGGEFFYTTSEGIRITPGKMETDGGSIPLILQALPKFSAWGYAPAYLMHDWLFVSHKCGGATAAKVEFPQSALLLAEAIKTLMEVGYVDYDKSTRKFPKSEDTLYLMYKAVNSSVAENLWRDIKSTRCIAAEQRQ
jgi:hypothetical protein